MSKAAQSWSLVVFCYNEAATVGKVMQQALAAAQLLSAGASYEVIVVDDGSTDGSGQAIDTVASSHIAFKIIRHAHNKGIGPALISGYGNAEYENICAIPADGQFELKELYPFASIPANEVISFYRPEKTGYGKYRKLLTWLNGTLNHVLLGLHLQDVNWVKVYKINQLQSLFPLSMKSSIVESEICAKLKHKGVVFREYPSTYLLREAGVPKGGSIRTVFAAAKEFLVLVLCIAKFKSKERGSFNLRSTQPKRIA